MTSTELLLRRRQPYICRAKTKWVYATLRVPLLERLRKLETPRCPFSNLPEKKSGRWGQGLRLRKWWTAAGSGHCSSGSLNLSSGRLINLRHSLFVALREDKKPKDVRREA